MNCTVIDDNKSLNFNLDDLYNNQSIKNFIKNSKNPIVNFETTKDIDEKNFVLFLNILLGLNLNVKWHGTNHLQKLSTNKVVQANDKFCSKLDINLPHRDFLEEIHNLEMHNLFVPHRTKDGVKGVYYNKGWSSFCLHGLGYNMTQGPEQYGYTEETAPYQWTEEANKYCPKMVEWFKEKKFKNTYHRVRIMKLSPGGMIGIHNDNPKPTASATNMAINNPLDCEMHFLNRDYEYLGIVPWQAGDVYKITIGLNHYVINKSLEDRYHFIIHGIGGYL